MFRAAILILAWGILFSAGSAQDMGPAAVGSEVTIKGSMVCNGARIPEPKADDHVMVVYAIDGTDHITAEVKEIMAEFYPDRGPDGSRTDNGEDVGNETASPSPWGGRRYNTGARSL